MNTVLLLKTIITILISINAVNSADTDYDFYCCLSYHPHPFTMKEWEIEIYRKGAEKKIAARNYTFKRLKADLPEEYYEKLQKLIKDNSVWSLRDYYYTRSTGGYYYFFMKEGKYLHNIKIEHGVPLTGTNSKYREIIRTITGLAKLVLEE